jgi:hypothetical protein
MELKDVYDNVYKMCGTCRNGYIEHNPEYIGCLAMDEGMGFSVDSKFTKCSEYRRKRESK